MYFSVPFYFNLNPKYNNYYNIKSNNFNNIG